jgi:thiosulfate dehydrogenase [quinone] large subunit
MLATGAVAVGVAALNLNKLQHLLDSTPNQTDTKGSPAQPGHAEIIFGHTTMAMNSAETFTNPADGQSSLLIHLPDNRFVAYEKACTHSQVLVAYDPTRKLLVCPAHGAMFDPADGGKAVLGPGGQPGSVLQPLANVKISIHGDGTIRPM